MFQKNGIMHYYFLVEASFHSTEQKFSLFLKDYSATVVHNVFRFLTFYNMINQRHGLKIVGKGIIRWGEGPVFRRSQLLSAEKNERIVCGQ